MLITAFLANDLRGDFLKDYSLEKLQENDIYHEVKEVFYTKSHKGVVRAIHFQRVKQQAKLVRCVLGSIYDVIVDLRKNSSTFGKWEAFELNDINNNELYIPDGCGHGYLVLKPSIVSYKCNEKFYSEYDDGIMWNDPDIDIFWPIEKIDTLILSDKDRALQSFKEFTTIYSGLQ